LASSARQGLNGNLTIAELYDPATGTWTATGSLAAKRNDHVAALLSDGRVLVAGGYDATSLASAQIYDPASGPWTGTGPLATARYGSEATRLSDGAVLVAGGSPANATGHAHHGVGGRSAGR
jgi:hypothetical protein